VAHKEIEAAHNEIKSSHEGEIIAHKALISVVDKVYVQVSSTTKDIPDLPAPRKPRKVKERVQYLQQQKLELQGKLKHAPHSKEGGLQLLSLKFRLHMATRTPHHQNSNEVTHGTELISQHSRRAKKLYKVTKN
jgi:hypothetical protein